MLSNVNVTFTTASADFNVAIHEYVDESTAATMHDNLATRNRTLQLESAAVASNGVPVYDFLVDEASGWRSSVIRIGRRVIQFNSRTVGEDALHDMALATAGERVTG